MDVKTTFLNGDLEEEIYMLQPEGCITPGQEHKVCKLNKSLYGLKQVPKQWHKTFDNSLLKNRFLSVEVDKCVHTKCTEKKSVIIALYVDDLLILGTSPSVVHNTKIFLASQFDMKDMGEGKVILGVKIIRMGDSIKLSQQTLIATSTMESEFIVLESAGKEAEWLRNFLSGIPLGMQPAPSVSIHCDC